MKNKIAIIDMGTNTFHLLLAEPEGNRFNITLRDRLAVKMGMGGINQGVITEAGIHRALLAMRSFKNTADEHGIKKIHAYGTSALRNASNRLEITRRIKALTDIDVNIIDGLQEADFIYHGVKAALDMEKEKSLIIDIGGGSVEFIIADNHEIFWKESMEIGAQRLLEQFQQHDPISPAEIANLDDHFQKSLANLFTALQKHATVTMVGSSGTFDTLSDIFCARHDIHKSPEEAETPLSIPGFHEIYLDLIHKPRSERLLIPGMIEMRVDMIVVACCLIRYILEHHPFQRIRVSTYALKEGVLATLIREMKLMV